jgi:hypothetical protein
MGRHAADTWTNTRANRGLGPCRGPSGRTCKEMPGTSCELNAGLKKIGTVMNLSSGADTHKSESLIPQRSRGHQPAASLNVIAQPQCDHASWAAETTRTGTDWRSLRAAVLEVLVSADLGPPLASRRVPASEPVSTCLPARAGKPAMIIVRAVTSDGPDGQPWPPPDTNTHWAVVRRADGCTLWRAIQLAEVRFAAPDSCDFPKAATKGPRHDTR